MPFGDFCTYREIATIAVASWEAGYEARGEGRTGPASPTFTA